MAALIGYRALYFPVALALGLRGVRAYCEEASNGRAPDWRAPARRYRQ